MFSLIITVISIALVAALALATLYYGSNTFSETTAKVAAAKLRNQGQQLKGAAELFYLQKGYWPDTIQDMVASGHLSSAPVAKLTMVQPVLAAQEWRMPAARQPVFVFEDVEAEVCKYVNQGTFGLAGVLPTLREGYDYQCFGPTRTALAVVVGRGRFSEVAATVNSGLLVPENVSSDPIPGPNDVAAWTIPPGDATGGAPEEEAPAPGFAELSPAALNFGAVATHFSETQDVTVSNTSTNSVSLDVPAVSGDPEFSVAATSCGPTLAAGASCTVSVTYAPSVVSGGQTATLSLSADLSAPLSASAYNPVSLGELTLPKAKLNKVYAPVDFTELLAVSNEGSPDLGQVAWEAQGELPAGLSFDDQTGTLSGTPTALTAEVGQDFTVLATYKNNQGQQVYTIRVGTGLLQVTSIGQGRNYTCAVTTAGGAKCWGDGNGGTLGNGAISSSSNAPVDVVGLTSGVASISVAQSHACAVTTAGGVKCWGSNGGRLGDGTTTSRAVPVDVVGLTSGVAQVAAGGSHSCAVTTSGGVKCWGAGDQVGDGGVTPSGGQALAPVNVAGLSSGVAHLSAGATHTCAVTTSGGAKCWGDNTSRQLGDGTTISRNAPVNVSGLTSGVASISGRYHHTCAVTTSGGAKCWGYNANGQLGNGTTTQSAVPVDVTGLTSGVSRISAGNNYTCAVTTSGGAKCWGANNGFQLGDGTNTQRNSPVNVAGFTSGVASISGGYLHTCLVTTSGGAKCWGPGGAGQLGNGANPSVSTTPVDVVE